MPWHCCRSPLALLCGFPARKLIVWHWVVGGAFQIIGGGGGRRIHLRREVCVRVAWYYCYFAVDCLWCVCVTTQHASQFILIVSVTYICQILSYGLYFAIGRCAAVALPPLCSCDPVVVLWPASGFCFWLWTAPELLSMLQLLLLFLPWKIVYCNLLSKNAWHHETEQGVGVSSL